MIKYIVSLLLFFVPISSVAESELATFAGGCFWCVESDLEKVNGVEEVISGYSGGTKKNPTYEEVSSGKTKYIEVVQVKFNSKKLSYGELLKYFWKTIDPSDSKGQFVDRGFQYTSAIFYHTEKQRKLAIKSKDYLKRSKKFSNIVTEVREFKKFYKAEEYHQNFYKKNKKSINRYKSYRKHSGRDQFIAKHWTGFDFNYLNSTYKAVSKQELIKKLNSTQKLVALNNGTEKPFKNEYWDNKKKGIYVDLSSGEPLFSSKDKFKSGTGWPSFTRPIDIKYMNNVIDNSYGMKRIEVRSKIGELHLGHLFNDGPKPTGKRYCINSASLRFIPKEKMIEEGYEEYLDLVK